MRGDVSTPLGKDSGQCNSEQIQSVQEEHSGATLYEEDDHFWDVEVACCNHFLRKF